MRAIISSLLVLMLTACNAPRGEILPGERISILTLERALTIDPRLSEEPILVPPPQRNQSWEQPGGLSTHASAHLALDGLRPLFTASKIVTPATKDALITATPVMAEGKVFVLGAALDLAAVDAQSGMLIWKQSLITKPHIIPRVGKKPQTIDADIEDGWMGGIAYSDGRIFVATGFGEVLAVDSADGRIIWRRKNRVPFSNAPTVRDGRIFVIGQDSNLHAYNADDGVRLWDYPGITEQASIIGATSPAVNEQVVVAGFNSGDIVALRVLNGTVNWSDTLVASARQITPISELNAIIGRPVIDRDRVFAISHGGRMVAIDLRTGERAWAVDIASIEMPWVMEDYVFVVTTESQLVSLSRALGRVRWVVQLPRFVNPKKKKGRILWAGPIVAGGQIILAASDGRLVVCAPQTGEIIRMIQLGKEPINVSPIVADGVLYVFSDSGTLFAFN